MKKVLVFGMLAMFGMGVTVSATSITDPVKTEMGDKKGKKKDKKKKANKEGCCKEGEKKACCKEGAKSCDKKK